MPEDIRKKLQPLEVLDLARCKTVGETVEQMEKCAIGARMIGEVARTITQFMSAGGKITAIYDGKKESELGKLLLRMQNEKEWIGEIFTPEEYGRKKMR